MKWQVYVMLFMMGCNSEPPTNMIFVEISPKKLLLEKRHIKMRDFESELKFVVGLKLKEGFKKEELTVNVKVDDKTRRGDIVDLETSMRRLDVRKVMYSTFDNKPQGLFKLE
jgi:hypothetical protein